MKRKSKRIIIAVVAAVIILLVGWIGYGIWLSGRLTVTKYRVENNFITAPLTICQLSDLHGERFGDGNAELIELIRKQEPDLIFMTGDMINRDETDTKDICDLVCKLCETAPVYYSYGNHEAEWANAYGDGLEVALKAAGATVLILGYEDVTVKGQALRIGGYEGYYRMPQTEGLEECERRNAFVDEYEDTDRQKLTLCHIPTTWLDWGGISRQNGGVVFCGHYHGGQIRLPFSKRGVVAPYGGWFPEYVQGVYYGERSVCILSAGLGSGMIIPRINNPPEIVVADLVPNM